jgi:Domain of unknown function (DUF4512)
MVCVPCFIIPVVLFFWRWLIQPYFVKYIWNPWAKKDKDGNVIEGDHHPEFIKNCEGGVCTFMRKPAAVDNQNASQEVKDQTTKKDD